MNRKTSLAAILTFIVCGAYCSACLSSEIVNIDLSRETGLVAGEASEKIEYSLFKPPSSASVKGLVLLVRGTFPDPHWIPEERWNENWEWDAKASDKNSGLRSLISSLVNDGHYVLSLPSAGMTLRGGACGPAIEKKFRFRVQWIKKCIDRQAILSETNEAQSDRICLVVKDFKNRHPGVARMDAIAMSEGGMHIAKAFEKCDMPVARVVFLSSPSTSPRSEYLFLTRIAMIESGYATKKDATDKLGEFLQGWSRLPTNTPAQINVYSDRLGHYTEKPNRSIGFILSSINDDISTIDRIPNSVSATFFYGGKDEKFDIHEQINTIEMARAKGKLVGFVVLNEQGHNIGLFGSEDGYREIVHAIVERLTESPLQANKTQ